MLKFEFVQPSEYGDPYYKILKDGKVTGMLNYTSGQWGLDYVWHWHNARDMMQISFKAAELNRSTKQQRIFAWEKLI